VSDGPDELVLEKKQSDELELASAWEAFVGSFTTGDLDLAERTKEILRAEVGGNLAR
jgi:hypothetical protein